MAVKKKSNAIVIPTEGAMRKKYGTTGLASITEQVRLWIPSRFLALNYQWGGGVPYGKIVELFGAESSGKSLLAFDFGYCTQELGGIVLWADSERSYSKEWAESLGLDNSKVWLYQENTVELISDWIMDSAVYWRSKLTNNQPILLVVDSLAVLECLENQNANQLDRKSEMGNRAKAIGTMLRSRQSLLDDLGVGTILINQLRSKIGASKFEDPDTTPGGTATKFYASIRCGVYGGKQIKKKIKGKEKRVGRVSSIRIIKNKVAPPRDTIKGAECYTNPDYTKMALGFNRYFGLDEIVDQFDIFEKKGSRYYLKGKLIANGKEKLMEAIMEDGDLRAKVIRKSGINTINVTQKKLDAITTNLYPVKAGKIKDDEESDEE